MFSVKKGAMSVSSASVFQPRYRQAENNSKRDIKPYVISRITQYYVLRTAIYAVKHTYLIVVLRAVCETADLQRVSSSQESAKLRLRNVHLPHVHKLKQGAHVRHFAVAHEYYWMRTWIVLEINMLIY